MDEAGRAAGASWGGGLNELPHSAGAPVTPGGGPAAGAGARSLAKLGAGATESGRDLVGRVAPVGGGPEPRTAIGISSEAYQPFVQTAVIKCTPLYIESLKGANREQFLEKPLEAQNQEVLCWLIDPQRASLNKKPRLEIRMCPGMSCAANIALAMPNPDLRDALFEDLKGSSIANGFSMVKGGSTTIELSSPFVTKATPMKYLANPETFNATLDRMGYTPGPYIDSRARGTVVFSDADGTIWNKPEINRPVEENNLSNSPAREAILRYLLSGGVLVINSGNDSARVARRFFAGLDTLTSQERHDVLSRVLFASAGGGSLSMIKDGELQEIEDYHRFDPQTPGGSSPTDRLYIGDDPKLTGNDFPAFTESGDAFICVAPQKEEKVAIGSEIGHRTQLGEVESSEAIFSAIVQQARTNRGASVTHMPLFSDMDAFMTNTTSVADSRALIGHTIGAMGGREGVEGSVVYSDRINQPVVLSCNDVEKTQASLLPLAEGDPLNYDSLMDRFRASLDHIPGDVVHPITAKASAAGGEEDEVSLGLDAFISANDLVRETQKGRKTLRILVPGNNDQATPITTAYHIKQLRKKLEESGGNFDNLNIQIIVMGKGGHATTSMFPQIGQMQQSASNQKTFSGTEEAISLGGTLISSLREGGLESRVVETFDGDPGIQVIQEKNSTNTGENVKCAVRACLTAETDYQLIVSARSSSLRQTLTFAHQYISPESGAKLYDQLWALPPPRGERFVRESISNHQLVTEFYASMAERTRIILYAMQETPYIPPFTRDSAQFQELLDNIYGTYARLEGISIEEAKTKSLKELMDYYNAQFMKMEKSIPWSKSLETQQAYTKGAIKTMRGQTEASQVRAAAADLEAFRSGELALSKQQKDKMEALRAEFLAVSKGRDGPTGSKRAELVDVSRRIHMLATQAELKLG